MENEITCPTDKRPCDKQPCVCAELRTMPGKSVTWHRCNRLKALSSTAEVFYQMETQIGDLIRILTRNR